MVFLHWFVLLCKNGKIHWNVPIQVTAHCPRIMFRALVWMTEFLMGMVQSSTIRKSHKPIVLIVLIFATHNYVLGMLRHLTYQYVFYSTFPIIFGEVFLVTTWKRSIKKHMWTIQRYVCILTLTLWTLALWTLVKVGKCPIDNWTTFLCPFLLANMNAVLQVTLISHLLLGPKWGNHCSTH